MAQHDLQIPAGRPNEQRARGQDPRAQRRRLEAAFQQRSLRRYLPAAAIALVWTLAAGYFFLTPSTYITNWSLILPAANSGSSVTLDTIGQASSNPGQPFGSVQLSPKVIYREIAASDQVRENAARSLGLTPERFGRPRIRLIDETSLMMFQMNGRTPEDARDRGRALITAFQAQLDALRRDEFDKRAVMMRDNLKIYQANLDKVRERILEFQNATGLMSTNQFTETSSSAELMRRKLSEKRSELDRASAEQVRLRSRIGYEPRAAAVGLKLAADPTFVKLAAAYAETASVVHENGQRYGPNHPALAIAQMRLEGVFAEISKIARAADVDPSINLRNLALFMGGSLQGELMRVIVANEAQVTGLTSEIAEIETALRRLESEVQRMGMDAARLEALKKDHLVAEAVFASAAARLDTNRTDVYTSYPLVQVLAEPGLPENRSQPRLSYALAAGVLGTLLVFLAMGAAWVRNRFSRTRLTRS